MTGGTVSSVAESRPVCSDAGLLERNQHGTKSGHSPCREGLAVADFPEFKLPGSGLKCDSCDTVLPRVAHTRPTSGMIIRERRCPKCGHLNKTIERVIAGTAKNRFTDPCGE